MSSQKTIFIVSGINWQAIVVNHLCNDSTILENNKLIPLCYVSNQFIDVADALNAFGYDSNSTTVQVDSTFETVQEYLNSISDLMFDSNSNSNSSVIVATGNPLDVSFDTNTEKFNDVFVEHGLIETKEKPEVNDVIYVDSERTAFTEVIGGKATISNVHEKISEVEIETGEYDEDDDEPIMETVKIATYFIETVELPGYFLNWSLLKNKQEELAKTYTDNIAELV